MTKFLLIVPLTIGRDLIEEEDLPFPLLGGAIYKLLYHRLSMKLPIFAGFSFL